MTIHDTQYFLDEVADQAPDAFKSLMNGIAEHFSLYGSLTQKQRKAVHVTASKLNLIPPDDLSNFAAEEPIREYHSDPSAKALLDNLVNKTRPAVKETIIQNPFADLLLDLAQVLVNHAEKIR